MEAEATRRATDVSRPGVAPLAKPVRMYTTDTALRPVRVYPLPGAVPGHGAMPADLPIESSPELLDLKRQVLADGRGATRRIHCRGDGVEQICDVTVEPIPGEAGGVAGLSVCILDVTGPASAQRAERRARDYAESLLDIARVVFVVLDAHGRVVSLNRMGCELLGCTQAAVVGADWIGTFIPERLRPELRRVLAEVLAGRPEPSAYFENPVLDRNGRERLMAWRSRVLRDADGTFLGVLSTGEDITEQRRRERELTTLAENSPDIIARFDRALRHLYVNAAAERATGRRREDFIGRTNEELGMPPDLCAQWSALFEEVFRTGEPRGLDFAFPAPDGERFYSLRAVPEIGPNGEVETVLSSARDETARHRAAVRADQLATVVESSSDFIGIASLDGRAQYLNRAGRALVGLEGEEAVRDTCIEDYLFPEDRPFVRETVLPAVMGNGRWANELRFRHFRTGEAIAVHWDVVRIDDPRTGRPARLATVTRDIRKEKAAEEALLEADRRKNEFLAILGHELRNPMAPIRSAVDIIRMLGPGDERFDWAIEVLERQTAHMSRLLDDLLDVSRIVRGQLRLDRRAVEIRDVVQQAIDGVRHLMRERGHRFSTHLPPPSVWVDADPMRLSQVLLNLLSNAAKYTPEGGEVRLSVEAGDAEVCVRLCDNGPGIDPELAERLFEPFVQGPCPSPGSRGGLGLGLTISRRITELHGGRLELDDSQGPGCQLKMCLPRLARSACGSGKDAVEGPPAVPLRVLVVDDEADVAAALGLLLRLLGHEVETACSGETALQAARRVRPRVALLDIGMEGMDGLELARRLRREIPDRERLHLVAVTGFGHEDARERVREAGFDAHLVKPVDRVELQRLLSGLQ